MVRNKKITLGAAFVLAIVLPVFAYMYQTEPKQINSGIVIATPTLELGSYWDIGCTQPVTPFEFGQIIQPDQATMLFKRIYMLNKGNVPLAIIWNSTLSSINTEIAEWWCRRDDAQWGIDPINGTSLAVGECAVTCYDIMIPIDAAVGTFNWTLTVWGVH